MNKEDVKPNPNLGNRTPQHPDNVTVRFSSCSAFCPGEDADYFVVQCYSDMTDKWYYHPGPPDAIGFTDLPTALTLAKKVALAGEINPDNWWDDYPLSTFEAAERKGFFESVR